jgi:hypothetical protein
MLDHTHNGANNMMTPAMLERGSAAFRRGYNDALLDRPYEPRAVAGTFAASDYSDGYKARQNEKKWDKAREKNR